VRLAFLADNGVKIYIDSAPFREPSIELGSWFAGFAGAAFGMADDPLLSFSVIISNLGAIYVIIALLLDTNIP